MEAQIILKYIQGERKNKSTIQIYSNFKFYKRNSFSMFLFQYLNSLIIQFTMQWYEIEEKKKLISSTDLESPLETSFLSSSVIFLLLDKFVQLLSLLH